MQRLFFAIFFLYSTFSFGGEQSDAMMMEMSKCRDLDNYGRLADCFEVVHGKSEAALMHTYEELINYLGGNDRNNLINAQHKWVEFRSADCKFSDPRQDESVISSANTAACLAENTIHRLEQLEQYNDPNNKGCNGCPW